MDRELIRPRRPLLFILSKRAPPGVKLCVLVPVFLLSPKGLTCDMFDFCSLSSVDDHRRPLARPGIRLLHVSSPRTRWRTPPCGQPGCSHAVSYGRIGLRECLSFLSPFYPPYLITQPHPSEYERDTYQPKSMHYKSRFTSPSSTSLAPSTSSSPGLSSGPTTGADDCACCIRDSEWDVDVLRALVGGAFPFSVVLLCLADR